MTDASPSPIEPDQEQQLARLKELLGADHGAELDALRSRFDDPEQFAQAVENVLPQAVSLRTQRDEKLSSALYPTVERAMQTSVKRNPKILIDVIFPVMGPAIRKAIREAIAGLAKTINRNVEYTFTPRGLKWRIEAWRTKKSLGEVVLAKSHVFRVEQVFLVHAETGLMLAHVTALDFDEDDRADLVSSMMTAIQDFARDSFDVPDDQNLEAFRVGDHIVLAERGPNAVLATVAVGDTGPELRETMQLAIEAIHRDQGGALEEFDGDVAPFEAVRPELETCLMEERREIKRSAIVPFLLAAVVVALLLWLAIGFFNNLRFKQRWDDYVARLRAQPGLVVVDERHTDGRGVVVGLNDPHAPRPESFLDGTGLTGDEVDATWHEFQSTHPEFVAKRGRKFLTLADSDAFSVRLESGVLVLSGRDPSGDLVRRARPMPGLLAGVKSLDVTGVEDADSDHVGELKAAAESRVVTFAAGQTVADSRQTPAVAALVAALRRLEGEAQARWFDVEARFTGHAYVEGTGDPATVSERRANAVLAEVRRQTWTHLTFGAPRGVGTGQPLPGAAAAPDGASNRRVSCVITVTRRSSPR